jgi:hypothetical protein
MTRRLYAPLAVVAALLLFVTSTCSRDDGTNKDDRVIKIDKPLVEQDETQGVYRRDLLFLTDLGVQQIVDRENRELAKRVPRNQLLELVPSLRNQENRQDVLDAVFRSIAIFRVGANVDPLSLAVALREQNFVASPVHVVGLASHWKFSPGTAPRVIDDVKLAGPSPAPPANARTVAVIDTGVIDVGPTRSLPGSTLIGVDPLSPQDRETPSTPADLEGHGTFIGSVIRQYAPAARVLVARLPQSPAQFAGHDGGKFSGTMASDELQLLATTIRVTQHLIKNNIRTAALNLSLGTVPSTAQFSEGDDVNELALGVRKAIDFWKQASWPKRTVPPVIAAVGNHEPSRAVTPPAPFVPAAYSDVHGVIAVDGDGAPADFTFLGWPGDPTTVEAPGTELLAPRGIAATSGPADQLWAWGGTSFATAFVSAQTAATGAVNDVPTSAVTPEASGAGPPDVLVID